MPNTAYITFKSKGFWIPECFIEVLSDYICETFESIGINTFSKNVENVYMSCKFNREGSLIGMVNISLDRNITNDEDKATLINVLNQTKTLIASKGPKLDIETLDAFESRKVDDYFKSSWAFPIKTQSLTATIDIIIQMLKGMWDLDNYSVYYTGFPNPGNMLEI